MPIYSIEKSAKIIQNRSFLVIFFFGIIFYPNVLLA